jgi:hypothetical protein
MPWWRLSIISCTPLHNTFPAAYITHTSYILLGMVLLLTLSHHPAAAGPAGLAPPMPLITTLHRQASWQAAAAVLLCAGLPAGAVRLGLLWHTVCRRGRGPCNLTGQPAGR